MQVSHESKDPARVVVPGSRKIQRDRILQVLIEAHRGWVPLPHIIPLAAQYNARIHELRRLGFVIQNKTQVVSGVRRSWFRLVPNAKAEVA